MSDKLQPGEIVLGKLGPEGMFIFAEDKGEADGSCPIAARIDEDGTVRISRYWIEKHFGSPPWLSEALNSDDGTYRP